MALIELAQNPDLGKKLEGELRDFYSLRVWPYRIIYQIIKNELIVFVVQIKHRQGVYYLFFANGSTRCAVERHSVLAVKDALKLP